MAATKPHVLVDTSVALPLMVGDHEDHQAVAAALAGKRLGLAGHAAFETFSVLTRLPPPSRRSAAAVGRLLEHNFPASRFLDPETASSLLPRLAQLGIAGGAVYDALVGAAAEFYNVLLLTRDRRAVATYRLLDVNFQVVS